MAVNETKLEQFFTIYVEKLKEAIADDPERYAFHVDRAEEVSARMKLAFRANSYNYDSQAIRMTCKELGIKHTKKSIEAFLERS